MARYTLESRPSPAGPRTVVTRAVGNHAVTLGEVHCDVDEALADLVLKMDPGDVAVTPTGVYQAIRGPRQKI